LRDVRTRYPNPAQNIYNVDETGLTTVQKPVKIIAGKGQKQVGYITSAEMGTLVTACCAVNAERGTLVTACCGVNAIGNSVPPFFVFPQVHFKEAMIMGGPAGCVGVGQISGWMNADSFVDLDETFHKTF